MALAYNIRSTLQSALGIRFNLLLSPLVQQGGTIVYDPAQIPGEPALTQSDRSVFNTPVFNKIRVAAGTYYDNRGREIAFSDYAFPDATVVGISRGKNIVSTPVSGRDGTVKELVSNGDHRIRIESLIVSTGKEYPADEVEAFRAIMEVNGPLDVTSTLFDLMGIRSIVVQGYDMTAMKGMQNIQAVTIDALSDEPLELELLNASNIQQALSALAG